MKDWQACGTWAGGGGGWVACLAAFVCSHRMTKESPRPPYVGHHALVSTCN